MESISAAAGAQDRTYIYATEPGNGSQVAPSEESTGATLIDGADALNQLLITREAKQWMPVLRPLNKAVKILDGVTGCYEFLKTVGDDVNENGRVGLKSLAAMFGAAAKSASSSLILVSSPAIIGAGTVLAGPLGFGAAVAAVGAGLYYLPDKASSLAKGAVSWTASWL